MGWNLFFFIFSTGFFHHLCDGSHHCNSITESRSMQGIALRCCCKWNGMIFYCPHTKQLYTASDYKLDEGRSNCNNLHYDSSIFTGLCNTSSITSFIEHYPEWTSVSFPLKASNNSFYQNLLSNLVRKPSESYVSSWWSVQERCNGIGFR